MLTQLNLFPGPCLSKDHRLIESYRAETARKEKEIEELTTGEPRVFQTNRCTACGGQLDLPAVHFMVSLLTRIPASVQLHFR